MKKVDGRASLGGTALLVGGAGGTGLLESSLGGEGGIKVQAEIEGLGRKALIVPTDVSQVAQVNAMVDKAKQTFGRVDILVNNAGWTGNSLALSM